MPEPTYTLDRHQAITTLEGIAVAIRRYDVLLKEPKNEELAPMLRCTRKQFTDLHNSIAATFGYPPVK